jgi:diguanylate cyclase (GGDEF)-like protein
MDHEGYDRLEIASLIRNLYRFALPVGAALALVGWLLLRSDPGSEALPAVALLLILLSALHTLSDIPRRTLHTFLLLGVGGFLLLEAAPQLLGTTDGVALARATLWFPPLSALVLLLFGRTLGRWLAGLPSAALLLLWAIGRAGGGDDGTLVLLLQVIVASLLAALLVDRAAAKPEREVDVFATEDALTAILDEPTLSQHIERRASDPDARFALILLTVDNFSFLSNEIGADGTDGVLRAVADFLENGVREAETVARWAPDSFLVLVANTDASEAATLAERLRRGMMRVPISGLPRLTVSIGVAVRGAGEGVEGLIARVESAAGLAKRGGGDQVMLDAGGGS